MRIDKRMARDIMTDAVECGIAYWMNGEATNVKVGRHGFTDDVDVSEWYYTRVSFTISVKGRRRRYRVTPRKIKRAFPALAAKMPRLAAQYVPEYNGDAGTDDEVFQFAAFGEVIFG